MKKKFIGGLLVVTLIAGVPAVQVLASDDPLPEYQNKSQISLTGTIAEIHDDAFELNYGQGVITVNLQDWEWEAEEMAYLQNGDEVTVNGVIDDGFFSGREIDARNLYLNREFVYLTPSNADAMDNIRQNQATRDVNTSQLEDGSYVTMTGVVSELDGDQFLLDAGGRTMRVSTDNLGYDPFDGEGLQRIQKGDRVQIYGEINEGFLRTQALSADRIVSLSQAEMNPRTPVRSSE